MLRKLLRSHLRPYKRMLLAVVVLQTVQVSAALTLPTINANIIDNGVLPGDQRLHLEVGLDHARVRADPGLLRDRARCTTAARSR